MLDVFVACPYNPPPLQDYREAFRKIERSFPYVRFRFADEKISSDVILERIMEQIRASSLCICDITGWNPNVTMELGLALGMGKRVLQLFMEQRGFFGRNQLSALDLPANIRGHNRISYQDAASLQAKLRVFVQQEIGGADPNVATGAFKALSESIFGLLGKEPGLKRFEIAGRLGMETPDVRSPIDYLVRDERIYQVEKGVNARFYQKGHVQPESTADTDPVQPRLDDPR